MTKRILVLNYEFPPVGGGGGVASHTLSKGYIQNGYEVDCITTWYDGLKKFEVVDGINVYRVPVWGRKDRATASMLSLLSFPILALPMGVRLCRQYSYTFINTHFVVPTGPLGYVLSNWFRIKNALSLHGGDIYDPTKKSSPHKHWYYRAIVRFLLNRADKVVAQSNNTKENTIKYYHPTKSIDVVPLPYEVQPFSPATREDLGLDPNVFYTISIGRLVKRKGFDYLIRSIARIGDQKVHALIMGDGPEMGSLKKLAESLGVKDRLHFLGFVTGEPKFQYLSNANVYVLSSVHEGFGIVLQEAMQVGLPLLSTKVGGQEDVVKEGVNGYFIDGTEQDLADKIMEIMSSNYVLKGSVAEFDPKRIAREYGAI